jgi:CubicO group peptidase (beta-lactamase class C family)
MDSLGEREIPARDIIVAKDGEIVYRHFSGARDEEGVVPMDGNEAYWIYSMSKPLTMACALRLIEEGKLALSDKVSKYIPEFSRHPTMTIQHLMSMTGGLDYDMETPAIEALGKSATTREIVGAIADRELKFAPGTSFLYSLCHDVVGGVIEVASGIKFGEYMKKIVFEPLGMTHSSFKLSDYHRENMCAQYQLDENGKAQHVEKLNPYRLRENYESGGAGVVTTIADYIKFATAMAQGGCGILKPETIALWHETQLTGAAKESFAAQFNRTGYTYALGVRVMIDNAKAKSPIGEFGWDGAAGAFVMIDTTNKVAMVYLQHVRNMGYVYQEIHPALRDLVYEGLWG